MFDLDNLDFHEEPSMDSWFRLFIISNGKPAEKVLAGISDKIEQKGVEYLAIKRNHEVVSIEDSDNAYSLSELKKKIVNKGLNMFVYISHGESDTDFENSIKFIKKIKSILKNCNSDSTGY